MLTRDAALSIVCDCIEEITGVAELSPDETVEQAGVRTNDQLELLRALTIKALVSITGRAPTAAILTSLITVKITPASLANLITNHYRDESTRAGGDVGTKAADATAELAGDGLGGDDTTNTW